MADQARWLEVSLVVDGEMAEAVSDVLGRFAANGVVVESDVRFIDDEDEGTPVGPVRVYGYLPINEEIMENRHRLDEALWHLGQIQALPEASYKTIADEDWMAAWKKYYHPIPIGHHLLILPAWLESNYPERIAVKIDPSMAFGTGTHPTTQLCLELIEASLRPGEAVIDVGCGSGILSIAALKLGASRAIAVDIDPQAVRSTGENAAANGELAKMETGQGSVEEILSGKYSMTRAPLVLANILAPVIIRLFEDGLARLVTPGGVLILSGILDRQVDEVLAAARAHGMVELSRRSITDWVVLAFQPE